MDDLPRDVVLAAEAQERGYWRPDEAQEFCRLVWSPLMIMGHGGETSVTAIMGLPILGPVSVPLPGGQG